MWSMIRRGREELNLLVGVISNRRGKLKLLGLQGHPHFHAIARNLNLPLRKTRRKVFDLLTVIVLKRVRESNFSQIIKYTACKINEEKKIANYLMGFNSLKIIHVFQGKKHLRTW